MAQVEPMDIDSIGSDFDNKENSLLNSNVLPRTPCTEKGYEELDVSELNMKLRYSITPASSPMSKSYTASCKDNKTYSINEDSLNSTLVNNNTNLTRSLNSSIVKCDVSKSPKLPLQALLTDQYLDINSAVRRSLDNDPNNITITINGADNIDENLSLPSTSSSAVQTPEATTPTKDIPKDGGSPIMRGLKSVLNMFRSSQSPIPPEENLDKKEPTEPYLEEEDQNKPQTVLASTPKGSDKNRDNNSPKRSSPLKESVTFNDDLERELQWKDETTIIFKQEKIPIHKLFLQQSTSLALDKKIPPKLDEMQNLNTTVEYMDISYNESGIADKTMTDIESKISNVEAASVVESEAEFLDCETTYTNNEQTEQSVRTISLNIEKNDITQDILGENVASQINEQQAADLGRDAEVLPTDILSLEANVQIQEQQNVSSALDVILSDNVVNEPVVTEVPIEAQNQFDSIKDEIHVNKDMNVTSVLDVTADKIESNNKDQSSVLDQHNITNNDEIKTSDFNKENCLLITEYPINIEIKQNEDSKEEKQLMFDVTMPLNIVTDDHVNNLTNKDTSNNLELVDKDHVEINANNTQLSNSGILQICENVSDTVHDHISNAINVLESTFNVEDNKTENQIENDQTAKSCNKISIISNVTTLISKDEVNYSNVINLNTQKLECDRVEIISSGHTNDTSILYNQTDFKEDCVSFLNNNEIQNNAEEFIKNVSAINDLEQNNLQNIEDNVKINELPLSDFENDLPSDIPLPSDDDIEKDSLMDNFAVNNEIEEFVVKTLDYIIKDETIDSLEPMDVCSQTTIITNSEHSNELTTPSELHTPKTPLPTLDEIQSNKESIVENDVNKTEISLELTNQTSLLPTSESEIINKAEMLLESAPTELLDNKIILPDTILESSQQQQCLNIIDTVTDTESAKFAGHENFQTFSNDSTNVEDIKQEEQNCNIITEECKNELLRHIVELKEEKILDEEIVTSANNSPYVSVNDFDLNIPKNDVQLDEIGSPFETKCKMAMSPPISPKLSRKGYNINFDEIDDPFATKTNIRMSPPPETSPNNSSMSVNISQKKPDIQKRVQQQNRRKSQPERQRRDLTKKRFNSSYNFDTRNSYFKEEINAPKNENGNNQVVEETYKLDQTSVVTTSETAGDNVETTDICKHEIENHDISNKNITNHEEVMKEEINSINNEPADNDFSKGITENISAKKFPPKNVFNLPEIDDMNFNPFVSKSKIRNSPSPTLENESALMKDNSTPSDPSIDIKQQPIENVNLNIEKDSQEDKVDSSDLSGEASSSRNTDKDFTMREVATEDEDTGEAPFLEAEEFTDVVKVSDFGTVTDMMQFDDLHANINNENKDEGELFIDAEAFEFLLNQNKSNTVADSGKESLFLKFDPLFAKRVSSDGVLAALNRLQRRQSTPKKAPETSNRNNAIDEEVPSVSSINVETVLEESNDETNITTTKPMMVVNPAINSLVAPRKSTTPPRINRRSLTFTSPAMAVIDRLLSLSGNSSTLEHDTSLPRTRREYNETDVALTQLRELLAEKEIHVHNLRSESKELKDRLATMESQVKTLEKESEERLKKVNDLNDRLTEKSKINKSMAVVVEEYERTIASLIAEIEQEKRRNAEERAKIISERDEQTAHLSSMEVSFSDLHSKYEKSKQIILSMKANEDTYKKSLKEFEDNLLKMQNNYELLKQHATSKLNHANQELEKFNRAHESEVLKLNAMIKRKDLHITSLEESLAQKTKANEELTAICDDLINRVG